MRRARAQPPYRQLNSHRALRVPTLYQFLSTADVRLPKAESFYGLALPLGGAEVSLQDLVRLYAALANNGELQPLRFTARDRIAKPKRILSPEAAFLTLEMLGNVPRPEMNCADGGHSARVYWKTGTSHGFRDAWSIAVFDHYVLGVWVGNFDGRANPSFVGRTGAAPLLFQIIDSLRAAWPEPTVPHQPLPGANLKRVEFLRVVGECPRTGFARSASKAGSFPACRLSKPAMCIAKFLSMWPRACAFPSTTAHVS